VATWFLASDSDLLPPSLLSSHSIRTPHVKPSASAFHTDPPDAQGNGIEPHASSLARPDWT
jgi:hypothetical protein